MHKSLITELANKSLLLSLDEKAGSRDAMLSHVHERFEVIWHGDFEEGRLMASYDGGYLSFYATKPNNYYATAAVTTKIYPKTIISARRQELVDTDTYDSVRLTFANIFSGFEFDHDKLRPVDVSDVFKKKDLMVKEGVALNVLIGSSSSYKGFPIKAIHSLDDLIFEFTSEQNIQLKDVNKYIEIVTKVISLYTKLPIDPVRIEVGLRSDRFNGLHEYAVVEYGKRHEYSSIERSRVNAVNINDADSILDAIRGAFHKDTSHELGIWFSFIESDFKYYYFDVTMSNMLSCAESAYYLLPQVDNTKRKQEFEVFLNDIKDVEIKPAKLKVHIYDKAMKAYTEPVSYEAKLLTLIKYSGKGPGNNADIAKYLSQLRNSLMHGTEPNWTHIRGEGGKPDYRVDVGMIFSDFRKILANVFIKYLQSSAATQMTTPKEV